MKDAGQCLFSLMFLATLAAETAHADTLGPDWYVGISGDLTWLPHSDTGYGGNAALGYRLWPNDSGAVRLEGELGYHRASGKDAIGNTHYYTYMGNLYYDFNLSRSSAAESHITPYVGAGIGDTTAHFGQGEHGNALAYQFMAGLSFIPSATPNTDWSVGWRYQGSSDIDGRGVNANSLELGFRFHL